MDFKFRYHPADEQTYEVAEVSSDFFISLFDADIEVMKIGNVFASFVREYREQSGQTTQEWAQSSTEEEIRETFADISDDPEDWDIDEAEWGPSSPFAPTEAKEWAQCWIGLIEEADDEILAALFPYNLDIKTGKSTLQKEGAIADLQEVVTQAECAQRHNAQLTVEAIYG